MLWSPATPAPIPLPVVEELAQRPQIIGIKNDADQFNGYYDLIRATAGQDFAVVSGGLMRNFVFGYQVGSPAYLCPIAPIRPDIALRFYDLLTRHQYDDAWQMVFQYEDPWLKAAAEMDWLRSIKSAIHFYGLYPNDRLRAPRLSHEVDQRQTIRQCLEQVFGPIEAVRL